MKCKCLESNSLWYCMYRSGGPTQGYYYYDPWPWFESKPLFCRRGPGVWSFVCLSGYTFPPLQGIFHVVSTLTSKNCQGQQKPMRKGTWPKQFWFLGIFFPVQKTWKKNARFFPDPWKKTSRNDLFLNGFNHQKKPSKFTNLVFSMSTRFGCWLSCMFFH